MAGVETDLLSIAGGFHLGVSTVLQEAATKLLLGASGAEKDLATTAFSFLAPLLALVVLLLEAGLLELAFFGFSWSNCSTAFLHLMLLDEFEAVLLGTLALFLLLGGGCWRRG